MLEAVYWSSATLQYKSIIENKNKLRKLKI
jgi:hypothetical protein